MGFFEFEDLGEDQGIQRSGTPSARSAGPSRAEASPAGRPSTPSGTPGRGTQTRNSPAPRGFQWSDLGRITPYLQQGWNLFQHGAQLYSQATGTRNPIPPPSNASPLGQLGPLLQALQNRQIPPLPRPGPAQQPMAPMGPQAPAAVPQLDATALLHSIIGHPQVQQVLQAAATVGVAGPNTVPLQVPASTGSRTVQLPLGDILNTIAALAGQSTAELGGVPGEGEGEAAEYLLGEDGDYVVDPASDDARAALVAFLFRLNDEAVQQGYLPAGGELDESDAWARDAGWEI